MADEVAADDVPLCVLSWCFEWLMLKLLAMESVDEAADSLDTNDLTIMKCSNR